MSGTPQHTALERAIAEVVEMFIERLTRELLERQGELTSTALQESSGWMAVERAAEYLDWPKQRLYKLSASGAVPHYKHDGRLLFRRDELDAWLAQFAQGERNWLARGGSV